MTPGRIAVSDRPNWLTVGTSGGVRSATMMELFTALALLSVYLSSFVDWQRTRTRDGEG